MLKRFKVGDKAVVIGFAPWNGSLVTITEVNDDSDPADYYVSRTLPEGVIDYAEASLNDNELAFVCEHTDQFFDPAGCWVCKDCGETLAYEHD